jgi:hypothetical protein
MRWRILSEIDILTYGGGVNSSALFFYMLDNNLNLDLVVFADTGVESPCTYETIEKMKKTCVERHIEFVTVKSEKGNLYEYYWKTKTIPTVIRRNCTTEFKIYPIRRYLRSRYGKDAVFHMHVGIAYEEAHRMRTSDVKYIHNVYFLVDAKIDREGCFDILKRHGFSASKSGCVGCIFNKRSVWEQMLKEDPKEFNHWKLLEMNNKRYPYTTFHTSRSLEDIEVGRKKGKDTEKSCDVAGVCFI